MTIYYGAAPIGDMLTDMVNSDNWLNTKLIPELNSKIRNLKIFNGFLLIGITGYFIYQYRKQIATGITNVFEKGRFYLKRLI